jgi:hypothetical protein
MLSQIGKFPPEEKPKAPKIPEGRPYKNVGDLAAEYKMRGIPRQCAWD